MNKEIKICKEDPAYDTFKKRNDIIILNETEHIEIVGLNEKTIIYVVFEYKEKKTLKVFLTGSIYKTFWRERIIGNLKNIDFFNGPNDDSWETKGIRKIEEEKRDSDYILYVITNPNSYKAMYDLMIDSEIYGDKTLYCFDYLFSSNKGKINDFDKSRLDLLKIFLSQKNIKIFKDLGEVIEYLEEI